MLPTTMSSDPKGNKKKPGDSQDPETVKRSPSPRQEVTGPLAGKQQQHGSHHGSKSRNAGPSQGWPGLQQGARGPRGRLGLGQGGPAQQSGPAGTRGPVSYARAAGLASQSEESKTYNSIVKEAKENPPILTVRIESQETTTDPNKKPTLNDKIWADILFEACKITPAEVRGINLGAGGPLISEVLLKKGSEASKYAGNKGPFKGFNINISAPEEQPEEITFRGVPLLLPDCELLHLVKAYGGVLTEDKVHHKPMSVETTSGEIKMEVEVSSTRVVRAKLPPNRRLRSYYFLQGPHQGDPMRRVVAEHKHQVGRQCGFCLKNSQDLTDPCPFNGKASACKKYNPQGRTSLSKYFKILKEVDGYVSLRMTNLWSPSEEEALDSTPVWQCHVPVSDEAGSWAEEPATLLPVADAEVNHLQQELQAAKRQLEQEQVKSRRRCSTANREAEQRRKALDLANRACWDRVGDDLFNDTGDEGWRNNLECMTSMLAITTSLGKFELQEGKLVTNGDPWHKLDGLEFEPRLKAKADARIKELIDGAEEKIKERLEQRERLGLPTTRHRSMSRSCEQDSDDEELAAKSAKLDNPLRLPSKLPNRAKVHQDANASNMTSSVKEESTKEQAPVATNKLLEKVLDKKNENNKAGPAKVEGSGPNKGGIPAVKEEPRGPPKGKK